MSWVVKAWKPELLAAVEREARRAQRATDDLAASLLELEQAGTQLREGVRRQRQRHEAGTEPAPSGEIRASKGRASLRDSPLSELFRATG